MAPGVWDPWYTGSYNLNSFLRVFDGVCLNWEMPDLICFSIYYLVVVWSMDSGINGG